MACHDTPLDKFLERIGHDGSNIIWPQLAEPLCRRSFHMQECLLAAFGLGYGFTGFDLRACGGPNADNLITLDHSERIRELMWFTPGVILGVGRLGINHAVAWDGEKVYDPCGAIYKLETNNLIPKSIYLI
jgi:hypothetical protein